MSDKNPTLDPGSLLGTMHARTQKNHTPLLHRVAPASFQRLFKLLKSSSRFLRRLKKIQENISFLNRHEVS